MDRERALALHKDALELASNPIAGMVNGAAWADIGWCALNLGDMALAEKLFTGALEYPSFFKRLMRPRNLLGLTELAKRRGDFETAQKYIDEARTLTDEKAMRPFQALVMLADGQLQAARGEHAHALELFNEAEARAEAMQLRPILLDARAGAAQSLDALGRAQQANEKRAQAQAMINEIANLFSDDAARNAYLEMISRRTVLQSVL
jgi:tetratricopeptide (TPR) repeat protein